MFEWVFVCACLSICKQCKSAHLVISVIVNLQCERIEELSFQFIKECQFCASCNGYATSILFTQFMTCSTIFRFLILCVFFVHWHIVQQKCDRFNDAINYFDRIPSHSVLAIQKQRREMSMICKCDDGRATKKPKQTPSISVQCPNKRDIKD